MRVLAVDFGTSNTVAAVGGDGDQPRVLSFGNSLMLPSAVFAAAHGLVVGREALRLGRSDPARFEANPKRRVDDVEVLLGTTVVPVVDLVSSVLRAVAAESLRQWRSDPDQVRLTHPAGWGPVRRSLLETAARRAGLGAGLVMIPEPVAAAARFLQLRPDSVADGQSLAVYDFGGGTFDVALVRKEGDRFTVVAADGRADIGGIDLDQAVLDHLATAAGAQHPEVWERLLRPTTPADRRAARALREDVERAKEALSDYPSTDIALPEPFADVLLSRNEFNRLIGPAVSGTVGVLQVMIERAGLRPSELAGVFLVGGSSRVPLVAKEIIARLGVVPVAQDQPETAVALGALAADVFAPGQAGRDGAADLPTPARTIALGQPTTVIDPDASATAVLHHQTAPTALAPTVGRRPLRSRAVLVGVAVVIVAVAASLLVLRPWQTDRAGQSDVGSTGENAVVSTLSQSSRPIVPVSSGSVSSLTPPTSPQTSSRQSTSDITSSVGTVNASGTTTTAQSSGAPAGQASSLLQELQSGKVTVGRPEITIPGWDASSSAADPDLGVDLLRSLLERIAGAPVSITFVNADGPQQEGSMFADGRMALGFDSAALADDQVLRAGPLYLTHYELIVPAAGPIRTTADVTGRTLCEVKSDLTDAFFGTEGIAATRVSGDTLPDCLAKLDQGAVDATLLPDFWTAELMRTKPGTYRVIDTATPPLPIRLSVARTDTDGKAAIEAALTDMIRDGSWSAIVRRHLQPAGLPVPTAPEVGNFTCSAYFVVCWPG